MMKILVLTDRYPPYYVGAYELMCYHVVEYLRSHDYDITILTTTFGIDHKSSKGNIQRVLTLVNPPAGKYIARRARQLTSLMHGLQNYCLTRHIAKKTKPDLAFIWHMGSTTILPIFAVQDLGIETLYALGSHWLFHMKKEYVDEVSLIKKAYRSALIGFRRFKAIQFNKAIFVSDSLKECYCQANFTFDDTIVIPNGLQDKWIEIELPDRYQAGNSLRILFVGRLEEEKGLEVIIEVMKQLIIGRKITNLRLDIIGTGSPAYIDHLEKLIKGYKLKDFIKLTGFIKRSKLITIYSRANILLFPSLSWEGMPVTILEAMARGLVVIASDIGGPKDIIEDGKDGFLVSPNAPHEIVKIIDELITSPKLLQEIGQAALKKVREKYQLSDMLASYQGVIEEWYIKENVQTHSRKNGRKSAHFNNY